MSEAMRRALGIGEPNFGTLWAYMHVDDGVLNMSRLIHPKAEPEFAFVADMTVRGADVDAETVAAAGRWAVALEVVDPRWFSYDFNWLDNTADGSSAAAYVLGVSTPRRCHPSTCASLSSRERLLAAAVTSVLRSGAADGVRAWPQYRPRPHVPRRRDPKDGSG